MADRVAKAAEAALAARHFVSAIDIVVGIGWLDAQAVECWRRGEINVLEAVVRAQSAAHLGSHAAIPILGDRENCT